MPVLAPGKTQIAAVVDTEFADELTGIARSLGRSRSDLVRDFCMRGKKDWEEETALLDAIRSRKGV